MKKHQKNKDKIAGFTMVELVVTIAVVGILASISVPRFINQTSQARISALNGVAGAIRSAVALSQTEYVAEGNSSTSTATTVTFFSGEVVTVRAGVGYPVASALTGQNGIGLAVRLDGFAASYLSMPADITPAYGQAIFNFDPVSIANCYVTYNDSTGVATPTTYGC